MNPQVRDLTGKKFNKLLVLEYIGSHGGKSNWRCLCDCGKETTAITPALIKNRKKSCGCSTFENRKGHANSQDIIGQKFNKLTVLSLVGSDSRGNLRWNCLCECGNEKVAPTVRLKNGTTSSCGCQIRISSMKRTVWHNECTPESTFKTLLDKYIFGANQRGLSFSLTEEQFRYITSLNCHYCGVEPKNEVRHKRGTSYIYNGIDRKNNDVGYEIKNCLPCCTMCNVAKTTHTYEEFLAWLGRVAIFQQPPCLIEVI